MAPILARFTGVQEASLLLVFVQPVGLAGPAFAQGGGASSTGSISGEIKDAQGGVLPGVTVTATSPAQIGALTAVTNEAGLWNAKFSGTVNAGWGLRVTPVLKVQSGAPYGRLISAALNYSSSQIVLVEPIGTRRQDTISVLDFRVEKQLRLTADRAKLGLFFDLFNALNSNTAVDLNWRSSAAFEKATTVLGSRIAKFGVKFDW